MDADLDDAGTPTVLGLTARVQRLEAELAALRRRLDEERNPASAEAAPLLAMGSWLRGLPPVDGIAPLVTVVVPTHERPAYLARALRSVQAQGHPAWEVIVVDDGPDPTAAPVLEALGDLRMRLLSTAAGSGPEKKRNLALTAARGSLIAYLDDDNAMGPDWLAGVAWAFTRDPELEVAYGARVLEYEGRLRYLLNPFDRARLARYNLADTNALAHRAGLPEAHWDEELPSAADWELLARLTAQRDPAVLHVLAVVYDHRAGDRRSDLSTVAADHAMIRERILRLHALRD